MTFREQIAHKKKNTFHETASFFIGKKNVILILPRGNTLDPRKYKKSIKKFLKKIRKHSDPFCFVAAMGYLYRVRAATPFSLTPSTWKLLVATAIMVA